MDKLARLSVKIKKCKKCELCQTRTRAVPGEGDSTAKVLLVGEAPGKQEDLEGRPFIGRAGKTLDDVLAELEITRNQLFITNIVKCRPPKNRVPKKPEVTACIGYLIEQIKIIEPDLIIALGQSAQKNLIGLKGNLSEHHGKNFRFQDYPVMVTYHPAAVVYNRKLKPRIIEDLKKIKRLI